MAINVIELQAEILEIISTLNIDMDGTSFFNWFEDINKGSNKDAYRLINLASALTDTFLLPIHKNDTAKTVAGISARLRYVTSHKILTKHDATVFEVDLQDTPHYEYLFYDRLLACSMQTFLDGMYRVETEVPITFPDYVSPPLEKSLLEDIISEGSNLLTSRTATAGYCIVAHDKKLPHTSATHTKIQDRQQALVGFRKTLGFLYGLGEADHPRNTGYGYQQWAADRTIPLSTLIGEVFEKRII